MAGAIAVAAAAAGLALALQSVAANHYLSLGLHGTLVYRFADVFQDTFLWTVLLGCGASAAVALLLAALRRTRPHDAALLTLRAAIGVLLLGALIGTVLWLRAQQWMASAHSLAGMIAYTSLLGATLVLAGVLLRLSAGLLPRLASLSLALARPLCLLVPLALLGLLGLGSALHRSVQYEDGQNLLLITVDTLRADHLGVYGYSRDTSPTLDRLGREGILFTNAAVQWPKTSPSLASMMTGLYGHQTGVKRLAGQRVRERLTMLAEYLRNHQYRTGAVVTNGNLSKAYGFSQGFETYVEMWEEPEPAGSEDAEYVTRKAVAWLEERAAGGKFFLWVHYADPHALYEPPGPYHEMFVGDSLYRADRVAELLPSGGGDVGGIPRRSRLGDERRVDYYVAQYDAEIRYMDEQIGVLLAELDALDLADETLVVFTADHGESLGDHNYFFEHGRLPYDDCVRAPLILRLPGHSVETRTVDAAVELIAIVPTVSDLLGLPPIPGVSGHSLAPFLRGEAEPPQFAFSESGYSEAYQKQVRSGDWKLIYIPSEDDRLLTGGEQLELYNLRTDPRETRNLLRDEPERAEELRRALFAWIARSERTAIADGAQQRVKLDRKTEASLRALGYIE